MFKASLDSLAKWLGPAILLFVVFTIFTIDKLAGNPGWTSIIPLIAIIPILIGTYIYSPKSYSVDMDTISINRIAGKFFINRKDIKSISAIDKKEIGTAWRTMGNGGLFGYTGYYSSSKLGKMRWFVSQRKNYVLITMNNDTKYLLSPDDVAGFLAATQS